MELVSCPCDICAYYREYLEHIENVPFESRPFFVEMYDRLCNAETNYAHYKAILDGTWPGAKNILTNSLSKIDQP